MSIFDDMQEMKGLSDAILKPKEMTKDEVLNSQAQQIEELKRENEKLREAFK